MTNTLRKGNLKKVLTFKIGLMGPEFKSPRSKCPLVVLLVIDSSSMLTILVLVAVVTETDIFLSTSIFVETVQLVEVVVDLFLLLKMLNNSLFSIVKFLKTLK